MFSGVFTALITPLKDDKSLDIEALEALVEEQIQQGISGLVPMGTTGESPTLSPQEHLKVIEVVVKKAAGRVPVIAGTGSNSTEEAVEMTERAKMLGIDASLQVAPYYNKPSQEGFYQHFKTIADRVNLPLIVYNIPGRSARNIENSVTLRLAEHKNIVGVKEASGDFNQMMEIISKAPADFTVLSGDDGIACALGLMGGKGCISVISNLLPAKMEKMMDAALEGNALEARSLHYQLLPLMKALTVETNPLPIKTVMAKRGYCKEAFRLPLCPLADDIKAGLFSVLEKY